HAAACACASTTPCASLSRAFAARWPIASIASHCAWRRKFSGSSSSYRLLQKFLRITNVAGQGECAEYPGRTQGTQPDEIIGSYPSPANQTLAEINADKLGISAVFHHASAVVAPRRCDASRATSIGGISRLSALAVLHLFRYF